MITCSCCCLYKVNISVLSNCARCAQEDFIELFGCEVPKQYFHIKFTAAESLIRDQQIAERSACNHVGCSKAPLESVNSDNSGLFSDSLMMQAGKEARGVSTVTRLTCYASVHRFTDEEQTEVADEVLLKVQLCCNSLHTNTPSDHNRDPV